jgi:hypothetical protein
LRIRPEDSGRPVSGSRARIQGSNFDRISGFEVIQKLLDQRLSELFSSTGYLFQTPITICLHGHQGDQMRL